MGVATSLSQADFPVVFLILGGIVVVVGTILLFGILVEAEREHQHLRRRGR